MVGCVNVVHLEIVMPFVPPKLSRPTKFHCVASQPSMNIHHTMDQLNHHVHVPRVVSAHQSG